MAKKNVNNNPKVSAQEIKKATKNPAPAPKQGDQFKGFIKQ